MIRLNIGLAVAVTALLAAKAARAADSAQAQDAQCMVQASLLEGQLSPQGKANANGMIFYYAGRMIGRNPKVDIASEAKEALAAVRSKDKAPAIDARCDKNLQEVARTLQKYRAGINAKP